MPTRSIAIRPLTLRVLTVIGLDPDARVRFAPSGGGSLVTTFYTQGEPHNAFTLVAMQKTGGHQACPRNKETLR